MIDSPRKIPQPKPNPLAGLDRTAVLSFFLALACVLAPGCDRNPDRSGRTGSGPHGDGHAHAHSPPHGGAPVVLGEEAYHLELLLDSATGTLTAYVLDGHMDNFIRIAAPAIEIDIVHPDGAKRLTLSAVESASTGEKTGDTSHFSGTHPLLKGVTQFDAILPRIDIRSRVFEQVRFNYPKGNESVR